MNLSTLELEELIRSDDGVLIQRAVDELEHRYTRRARALAAFGRRRLAAPEASRAELPFLALPVKCRDQPILGPSEPVRLQNLLHRLQIRTLEEFEDTSWTAIAALSGMGRRTVAALIKAVGKATTNEEGGADWGGVTDVSELPVSLEATSVLNSWGLETIHAFQALSPEVTAASVRTGLVITDALIDGRMRWISSSADSAGGIYISTGDAGPMPPDLTRGDDQLSDGLNVGALLQFIRMFNRWQCLEPSALTLGRAIDGDREQLPADLQSLADACVASGILEDQDRSVPTAQQEFETWLQNRKHRERQILLRRVLLSHNQENLAAIGEDFGVSRERIRQLANRLEAGLLEAVANGPDWQATRWKVHRLKQSSWRFVAIDDLARFSDASLITADSGLPGVAFCGFLVLASAMRAHKEDGWIERDLGALDQAVHNFNTWLQEAGWCAVEEASQEAIRLGCHPESVPEWLKKFTESKVVEDGLIYWPDGYEGRISAILERSGEPLSVTEICEVYGPGAPEPSIRGALSRHDSFIKVSRSAWGLARWGDRAFEGIAWAIKAKIEERGGEALVGEISEEIAAEYDVRANSVVLISQAPCFKAAQGKVTLRHDDDPYTPKMDLRSSRGLFLRGPSAASFLLKVTRETLRGSGTAIPEALGAHLRILPGARKGFHLQDQKVTLSWPVTAISGPTLGSMRSSIRSMGIETGEMIRLDFDLEDTEVSIRRVDLDKLADDSDAALRAATGLSGSGEELYTGIARSLRSNRDEVRGILVRRGDEQIASWIPPRADSPGLDQALRQLGQAFPDSG